jgi:hypothetical protein
VRFADDFIVGFQYEYEARGFSRDVKERLGKFNLELAENKTRLMRFGRLPFLKGKKLDSFDFLGFHHVGGQDRRGRFAVFRLPTRKSCSKFLDKVKQELERKRHARGYDQQRMLTRMMVGFFRYFGVRSSLGRLNLLRQHVMRAWRTTIRQKGQRSKDAWYKLNRKPWFKLPHPVVYVL